MKARQSVTHVPVEQLTAHPANIRTDLGDLTEMAMSVAEHGILQPLTATEDLEHDGKLLLLAGHRRLGAAMLAKLDVVPVIVRHGLSDPAEQLVVMLVENTQRKDLNAMDRAEAYGALRNRGLTTVEIGRRTGTHFSTVSYYLNLLQLDETEREEVRTGSYASTVAIADVREKRQEARVEAGAPLRGRPKQQEAKYGSWFNPQHRLAGIVRARCDHHGSRVGSVGCGPCWEQAIREEETPAHVAEPSRAEPSRAEPSRASAVYDEAVVIRRLNGDHMVRTRKADTKEIVRRAHSAGWNDLEGARITGISSQTFFRVRRELGLSAHGDGGQHHRGECEAS